MQVDLFAPPVDVRENCEKLRNDRRTSSQAPSEKGKCVSPHFPFTGVRESAAHFPFSRREGPKARRAENVETEDKPAASQIRDAMAERMELETQLADAMDAEEAAEAVVRPYDTAFWYANEALVEAINEDAPKPRRLNLYTARMQAGHQRNPYKKAREEAASWRRRIEQELGQVNARIERLSKR